MCTKENWLLYCTRRWKNKRKRKPRQEGRQRDLEEKDKIDKARKYLAYELAHVRAF